MDEWKLTVVARLPGLAILELIPASEPCHYDPTRGEYNHSHTAYHCPQCGKMVRQGEPHP